ncbi:hypothetical protein EV192_106715 [Actinocrispum wychmicini]|uniref:Uncharacterized protein n=1 Tax=Actinocrispum wychmicini TaxID=1213861 RepID=A0A4R2JJP6_9PSEU|nr:hypothetical protein EV192_106715 [Actinocrispum wychmicini]
MRITRMEATRWFGRIAQPFPAHVERSVSTVTPTVGTSYVTGG